MKPVITIDSALTGRRDLKNGYLALKFAPFPRAKTVQPGQFVHIGMAQASFFYRRAFSVSAVFPDESAIEILIKVVGRGTRALEALRLGDPVNLLGPLGHPYTAPRKSQTPIMVAGGVGLPPVLFLAESLIAHDWDPKDIIFFYGGRSSVDIVERSKIKKLGLTFRPLTQDGSFGEKGMVTTPLRRALLAGEYSNPMIYSCGPEAMLKAVDELATECGVPGELALEAPMPCGFGICLGCVTPLRAGGFARICHEGPVFPVGSVILH